MPKVIFGSEFQNAGVVLTARVVKEDGSVVAAADIATLTYSVIDTITGQAVASFEDVALDPAEVFASLSKQNWYMDSIGYNFKHTLPAAARPLARTYRVEYRIEPAVGETCWVIFSITSPPALSS